VRKLESEKSSGISFEFLPFRLKVVNALYLALSNSSESHETEFRGIETSFVSLDYRKSRARER
jgi:hypothetical protein